MYKSDWMLRQIEGFTYFLSKMLFNKDRPSYEIREDAERNDADLLYYKLMDMIEDLKYAEAENLLFDSMKVEDPRYLEVAIAFYDKLNKFDDTMLEAGGFSRDEIEEGLKDAAAFYGVDKELLEDF